MESNTIFAALREALAALYPEEQDARVVVNDAGLNAHQITFSSRAQTNWHNILTEALRQNRLDALQTVYGQYRHLIDQGGRIKPTRTTSSEQDPTPIDQDRRRNPYCG